MINLRKQRQKFSRNSLMFNAFNDQALIQIRLNSGCFKGRDVDELNSKDSLVIYNFLCSLLAYSLRTLTVADGSRYANIVVLIDSSRVPVKVLRVVLRACQNALAYKIKQAVVIAPERFLDQQRMSLDILLDSYEFKTTMCARSKLWKYVDSTMLYHDHFSTSVGSRWLDMKKKFEDHFRANPAYFGSEISTSCIGHLSSFTKRDQSVMIELSSESVKHAETKIAIPEDRLQVNSDDESKEPGASGSLDCLTVDSTRKKEVLTHDLHVLEARSLRLQEIVGWLEGPCEKSIRDFSTQTCESISELDRIVGDHESLTAKIEELKNETRLLIVEHAQFESNSEVGQLWDKMVGRLDEMERRVQQSVLKTHALRKFHGIKSEFYKEADVLLRSLCSDLRSLDLLLLKQNLAELDFKTQIIEDRFEEAVKTSTAFCTLAKDCRPRDEEKNEQTPDVVYISEQLSFLNERRRRCLGLSDMRKLKLQQFIQLFTCELDAKQVIEWMSELRRKLRAGDPLTKITKFEEVAKKMEKYGTELLEVSLLLRRSLRLDVQHQVELHAQFRGSCIQFSESKRKNNP